MKALTETAQRLVKLSESKHARESFPQVLKPARNHEIREIQPDKNTFETSAITAEETARLRELKAEGKRRKSKNIRKDKWIAPELREEVAAALVAFVIKRIEFPRYGNPIPITETSARFSREEATQCGLLAIHESGFFRHGFSGLKILRAIRNAIQGKHCFMLRCKNHIISDNIAAVADAAGIFTAEEVVSSRMRKSQVASCREVMRALRAAYAVSTSQRAFSAFKGHRDFFNLTVSIITGRKERSISSATYDVQKLRFVNYLAIGAEHLRATRQPVNLGAEIMQALEMRGLAKA